jgi:hypothetical protein
MIEELLKGEVVLFTEKKDGTIVVAGSQLELYSQQMETRGNNI